jgi:hypothetical protein
MNRRTAGWTIAGVALVCASLAFLFRQPAATAQTKVTEIVRPAASAGTTVAETLTVKRYQMVMTGTGNSFIVMDTATGHCWKSNPEKREWLDIGAPPSAPATQPLRAPAGPTTVPPPPK